MLAIAQAIDGTYVGLEDDFGTPARVQAEEYFWVGGGRRVAFLGCGAVCYRYRNFQVIGIHYARES